MRTDLDIGARNPVTTMVTGFFIPFFEVKLKRYHFPKNDLREVLELNLKNISGEFLNFMI